MLLAADAGNTSVTFGGLVRRENGWTPAFSVRIATARFRAGEDCSGELRALLAKAAPGAFFEDGVLVSVVPEAETAVAACVKALTGKAPLSVTWKNCGLAVEVDFPDQVGRDRFADAAAAAALFSPPVVTVDMGTATTFNVITEGPVFQGGVITPGAALGLRALHADTSQLPPVELFTPRAVIGKNTEDCMRSGAVAGAAALADGIAAQIERELGRAVTLVVTGGFARWAEPLILRPHVYDPDLLLKGLGVIYEKNRR